MKRFLQILSLSAATLLLAAGCSKDKKGGENNAQGDSSNSDGGSAPPVTELKSSSEVGQPGAVSRKKDGLWYEAGASSPFSGRVVHEEDDNRWEEKFEKGVRTFLRAWDKDGEPVELHSWNADGSPKN